MTAFGPPPGSPADPSAGGRRRPLSPRLREIDLRTVHPLDAAVIVAALFALIFSCFLYYTYRAVGDARQRCISGFVLSDLGNALCNGDSASAWHGLFGWLGAVLVLLAGLAVAAAVFVPHLALPAPMRLVGVGLGALGVISTLIAYFVVPDWPPVAPQHLSGSVYDANIGNDLGPSWYLVLILGVAVTGIGFLRFQQTGGHFALLAAPRRGRAPLGRAAAAGPAAGFRGPTPYGPQQYGSGEPQYGPPAPDDRSQNGRSEYGQPQYGQPQYGQPQYGQPQYGQGQYGAQQYGSGEPRFGPPAPDGQPQYGQPQYGQRQYGQGQYGQGQYGAQQYGSGEPRFGPPAPDGQPQYGQPQYGQPQYGQPQYGQPQYGQPQYGQGQYGPANLPPESGASPRPGPPPWPDEPSRPAPDTAPAAEPDTAPGAEFDAEPGTPPESSPR